MDRRELRDLAHQRSIDAYWSSLEDADKGRVPNVAVDDTIMAGLIEEYGAEVAETEWAKSTVPTRYRTASFEGFERRTGTELALSRSERWADRFEAGETGRGLYLAGPWGSGKTHLICAAARRVLVRTLTLPHFVSCAELIDQVKGGDKFDSAPIGRAKGAELLLLDDVGQVGRTEFDRELIFGIFASRYEKNRPTLITSNLPPERLEDRLGGAFVSRIYECCEVAVLTASDYRKVRR